MLICESACLCWYSWISGTNKWELCDLYIQRNDTHITFFCCLKYSHTFRFTLCPKYYKNECLCLLDAKMSGNMWGLRPLAPGQSAKGTQWWLKFAHFCRQFSSLHEIMQGHHLTPERTGLTGSLNKGHRKRMDLLTKIERIFPVCLSVVKNLKLSFK